MGKIRKSKPAQKKAALDAVTSAQRTAKEQAKTITDHRQSTAQLQQSQAAMQPVQRANKTGLPDDLKSGMENLSGMSLDHVKVHYNSPKPAAVQAHAYAQGNEIHLGAGQEKHLPHELGHVVQQAQGRVKATTNVNGMPVNDHAGLENEATAMGNKALQRVADTSSPSRQQPLKSGDALQLKITKDKLNVVGENHTESDLPTRREKEKAIASTEAGGSYWTESEFNTKGWFPSYGDDPDLRARQHLATLRDFVGYFIKDYGIYSAKSNPVDKDHAGMYFNVTAILDRVEQVTIETKRSTDPVVIDALPNAQRIGKIIQILQDLKEPGKKMVVSDKLLVALEAGRANIIKSIGTIESDAISLARSKNMAKIASGRKGKAFRGIWKIGSDHVKDILNDAKIPQSAYELTSRKEFNDNHPDLPLLPESE